MARPVVAEPQEDEVDLRQLLNLLLAGRVTIAAVVAVCVLLGGLYCLLIPPTFEADGLVQVEDNTKSGGMSDLGQISSLLLGTPVETEAEIQILQSRLVIGQVIKQMNLQIDAGPSVQKLTVTISSGRSISPSARQKPATWQVSSPGVRMTTA